MAQTKTFGPTPGSISLVEIHISHFALRSWRQRSTKSTILRGIYKSRCNYPKNILDPYNPLHHVTWQTACNLHVSTNWDSWGWRTKLWYPFISMFYPVVKGRSSTGTQAMKTTCFTTSLSPRPESFTALPNIHLNRSHLSLVWKVFLLELWQVQYAQWQQHYKKQAWKHKLVKRHAINWSTLCILQV